MENPATWKPAEVVIMDAYQAWHRAHRAGAVGPSLPHCIAEALRSAGILDDEHVPEVGWDGLREARESAQESTSSLTRPTHTEVPNMPPGPHSGPVSASGTPNSTHPLPSGGLLPDWASLWG